MFNKIFHKTAKTEVRRLEESIEQLEEGESSALPLIYSVFAFGDTECTAQGGRAIRRHLERYEIRRMMRLNERFRRYTSMEWRVDWSCIRLSAIKNQFESEQDYYYALILGSFHPNGYHRESCLAELAACPGSLPYLILRLNDWVGTIRAAALHLALDKIAAGSLEEILTASQALAKIRRSGRREDSALMQAELAMRERIREELAKLSGRTDLSGGSGRSSGAGGPGKPGKPGKPDEPDMPDTPNTIPELLAGYPYTARRDIYELLFSEALLKWEDAEALMEREKNGQCQGLLFSRISVLYDCPDGWEESYLYGKSSVLRRKALEYKYDRLRDAWPGLEALLLDPCRGIREYAAFILEKYRHFDVPGFYTEHLSDEDPAAAILGLGETGERSAAGLLLPFLKCPEGKTAGNALLALGRLIGLDGGELFRPYLFDLRIFVSKAAYLTIRKNGIPCGAKWLYREFERCTADNQALHVRKYLLKLLLLEKSWARLPYLLHIYREIPKLCGEGEEARRFFGEMRDPVLRKIRTRGTYETVTAREAEAIRRELELCGGILESGEIEAVEFDLRHVCR